MAESTTIVAPSATPVTDAKTVRPVEVTSTTTVASQRLNTVTHFLSDLYLCKRGHSVPRTTNERGVQRTYTGPSTPPSLSLYSISRFGSSALPAMNSRSSLPSRLSSSVYPLSRDGAVPNQAGRLCTSCLWLDWPRTSWGAPCIGYSRCLSLPWLSALALRSTGQDQTPCTSRYVSVSLHSSGACLIVRAVYSLGFLMSSIAKHANHSNNPG